MKTYTQYLRFKKEKGKEKNPFSLSSICSYNSKMKLYFKSALAVSMMKLVYLLFSAIAACLVERDKQT
jgi:hypothetical protein